MQTALVTPVYSLNAIIKSYYYVHAHGTPHIDERKLHGLYISLHTFPVAGKCSQQSEEAGIAQTLRDFGTSYG
jgi:hypothetical protein